jgi:natural product precursor
MKRKKLTRLSFEALEKEMPVLSFNELSHYVGGNSCLLYCYEYLGNYSVNFYEGMLMSFFGYNTSSGQCGAPGVCTSDMEALGSLGGLNVFELTSSSYSSGISVNSSTGKLGDGSSIIMIFNTNGAGHAVVVTGVSNGQIQYYDPSNGTSGSRANGDYSAMYAVTSMSSSSSYTSGYYNSGDYTYYW